MKMNTVEIPTYDPMTKYLKKTNPEMRGSSCLLGGFNMQSGSAGLKLKQIKDQITFII